MALVKLWDVEFIKIGLCEKLDKIVSRPSYVENPTNDLEI